MKINVLFVVWKITIIILTIIIIDIIILINNFLFRNKVEVPSGLAPPRSNVGLAPFTSTSAVPLLSPANTILESPLLSWLIVKLPLQLTVPSASAWNSSFLIFKYT